MVGEKKERDQKQTRLRESSCCSGKSCAKDAGVPPVLIVSGVVVFFMLFFNPEYNPSFPGGALIVFFCFFSGLALFSRLSGRLCHRVPGGSSGRIFRIPGVFASGFPLFAAAASGILLSGLGLFRIHADSLYPRTLASLPEVSSANFRLKTDPVPAGENYKAEASVLDLFYSDGTEFSADGNITVFFPGEIVTAALPENTARGNKRVYITAGLGLLCEGGFSQNKRAGGAVCFYVSDLSEACVESGIKGKIMELRGRARMGLLKNVYGWGNAGGFFLALSSGMREFMDASITDIFRRSGLSHILALSGMHLGIIGGAVLWIGGKTGGRRFAVRFSLLVLVFFLFFAGYSPSLFRACLFSLALAAVRRVGFPVRFLPVLACVFCLHVLLKPADIYSVSFQLSYLATAGIFSAGEFFKEILRGILPDKLLPSVSVSLGAQFAVFPVTMSVFKMFAPAGIIAGLCLSIPVSFFLISGFCCVLLSSLFPIMYGFCGFFITLQYDLIYNTARFFSEFPLLTPGGSILYAPASMCILYAGFIVSGIFVLRMLRLRRMLGVDFSGL